jgi:N6-L-threonylcarbamoyladenine synthase
MSQKIMSRKFSDAKKKGFLTLGIESSCDDTSLAILRDERELLAVVKKSQTEFHENFGGVVPEIAARKHTEAVFPLLQLLQQKTGVSLSDIDLVAATCGPGLIGSLLVGLTLGKAIALRYQKSLIAVHHLESHFAANFIEQEEPELPAIGLLISGGHSCLYRLGAGSSYELLGETRDDAAGELYDKIARQLGLGGAGAIKMDEIANTHVGTLRFTPPLLNSDDYDFSFSGLKTACLNAIAAGQPGEEICYGMQRAVIKVLLHKSMRAMKENNCRTLLLAGGVAANRGLRKAFTEACQKAGYRLLVPSLALCTDNAAMVAKAGYDRYCNGYYSNLDVKAFSRMPLSLQDGGGLWQQ